MLKNGIIDRDKLLNFFHRIPDVDYITMHNEIADGMKRYEMFFHGKKGKIRVVPMTIKPFFISKHQKNYFRRVYSTIDSAVKKVYWFYKENPWVKEVIPLDDEEEKWFEDSHITKDKVQNYFGRVDVTVDLYNPEFENTLKILEINMVGIGATYYSRCASFIADEVVAPILKKNKFPVKVKRDDDYISIILSKILEHTPVKNPYIGLMQDEKVLEGPFEFHNICEFYNNVKKYKTSVVDPEWIEVKQDNLFCKGKKIDILYRDPTVQNLIEMEKERRINLKNIRFAFKKNKIVSCITGEFDHKAVLEIFTNDVFQKKLTAEQRKILGKHIPWTRCIRETKTTSIEGEKVDLLEYVRKNRGRLILKPNRDYGGYGIVFGCDVSSSVWDKSIDYALKHKASYVAQEKQNIFSEFFPILKNNNLHFEEFYTVLGFSATKGGTSFLARLAKEKIVNITRSGSVAGVFIY